MTDQELKDVLLQMNDVIAFTLTQVFDLAKQSATEAYDVENRRDRAAQIIAGLANNIRSLRP